MHPGPMPFPPFMMPPPPRRGGAGRTIAISLLVLLLIGSVVLNVVLAAAFALSDAVGSHGIVPNTLKSGAEDQEVAVIPLDGIITDSTKMQLDRFFAHVDEDKNVKALVIEIDSPGGEVTPSDEIYNRITKYRADHPGIPVAVSMRSMATSGGYYAACGAEHIVAEETTVTGSIGVLWPRFNIHDLMNKYGVKDTTIVSTGAPFKDAGSPFDTTDERQEKYLQGLVDQMFTRFKDVVETSRKGMLTAPISDIANGKAYTAEEAKKNGLIDEIGYLDKAVAWASGKAGLTKPNVVKYEEKISLVDRFPFAQSSISPKAQSVTVNGLNVNVDRQTVDRVINPRPMYLWRAH
jgi:protease-4